MADELHPLTTLLLARMKSHPDEFMVGIGRDHVAENDRWGPALASVYRHGSEADKAALKAEVDVLRMTEAHEWTMDELCNGSERRRIEEEEAEYERTMMQQVSAKKVRLTATEVAIIDKLTKDSTPDEREDFIRKYARSKRETIK